MSQEEKKPRRSKTAMDVIHEVAQSLCVIMLIATVVFAVNYKNILQAIHDFQEPTCRVVK